MRTNPLLAFVVGANVLCTARSRLARRRLLTFMSPVISLATLLAGVAFGLLPQSDASAADPGPTPSPVTAAVDTRNFAYAPTALDVVIGTAVRFTNSDASAHTVTSDDGSFDSRNLGSGASWSHVFATAGTFTYYCAYHRFMRGTIVVTAPAL